MENSSRRLSTGLSTDTAGAPRSSPSAACNLILVMLCGIFLVVGCSRIGKSLSGGGSGTDGNRPTTSSTPDLYEETTGVPECDEVMKMLSAEANNPDDGYIAKAIKGTFLNKIRENVKKSIEENKTDKVALAKDCRDFRAQLQKFKAEENANKK